jgi:chromate transport protein ChrA
MYALAIGISCVSHVLPLPIYALLSGLNASTVGVIAFAAVQLAIKAITDPLSRLIVVFSACVGLCYNALWYFPVLMEVG